MLRSQSHVHQVTFWATGGRSPWKIIA